MDCDFGKEYGEACAAYRLRVRIEFVGAEEAQASPYDQHPAKIGSVAMDATGFDIKKICPSCKLTIPNPVMKEELVIQQEGAEVIQLFG